MRAAAAAAAVIFAFLGVMYIRFASDAVPPAPEPTASPDFGPVRIVARSEATDRMVRACEHFTRYPKPPQCQFIGNPDYFRVGQPPPSGPKVVPTVRVVNTDNSCLNIRVAPDPSAEILDCAAEGVLLRASDQFADDANGVRWRAVTTPSGIEGWASTQYLEY